MCVALVVDLKIAKKYVCILFLYIKRFLENIASIERLVNRIKYKIKRISIPENNKVESRSSKKVSGQIGKKTA
jgi:hypothetical protein